MVFNLGVPTGRNSCRQPARIVVAEHLLIEGATRRAGQGQGGLATPAARRLTLQILVAAAVACGTFAWLR
jgi:hypothetical protein